MNNICNYIEAIESNDFTQIEVCFKLLSYEEQELVRAHCNPKTNLMIYKIIKDIEYIS